MQSSISRNSNTWHSLLLIAGLAMSPALNAATYYVATANGDDLRTPAQAQNIATPWKSIQKAASSMVAGDTCLIRGGTYRETGPVTPVNTGTAALPITFQAYNAEVVTISGLDTLSGWTAESGVPNSWWVPFTGMSNADGNQVFQNSVMKPEARWPNAGALFPWQDSTLAHPTFNELGNWSYANSGSYTISAPNAINGTFVDPQLPARTANYWNGATVHMLSGYGWIMAHPMVTAHNEATKTLTTNHSVNLDVNGNPNAAYAMIGGNEYYLTGKKGEMDTAGEWFYDSVAARLYFYSTTSAPTGVEAKRRDYGFNLSGKAYVRLIKLGFFACTLQTDTATNNITYDGLNMRYLGHSSKVSTAYGIDLRNNDTLRNSDLGWDSQALVRLRGSNIRVINNLLHDSGYVAHWTAMVDAGINTISSLAYKQNLISRNTLRDSGRSLMGYAGQAAVIEYNDMINGMRLTTDGGLFYSNLDGGNTVFRYNILRDAPGPVDHDGAPPMGFYLDSENTNWIVHHNIVSNVGGYVMHINARTNFNKVFNNTCWSTNPSYAGPSTSFNGDGETGSTFFNNIFAGPPNLSQATWADTDLRFNLYTNPGFVSAAPPFLLQSTATAVNAGTTIPNVTTNTIGAAPDIGAQEYGAADWTPQAGYHTTAPSPDPAYSVPETIFVNKVMNQSFESGALAPNWTSIAGSNIAFQAGHSWNDSRLRTGGYSLKFGTGTSEVYQTVTGLQSDRRYKFHVAVQTADTTAIVKIGVRSQGYATIEYQLPPGINAWEMHGFPFITGPSATSAQIYVRVVSTTATPVYVDDAAVIRVQEPVPQVVNSPMVQYPFDQTSGASVTDASIYSRTGTVNGNTAPLWQAGVTGNALHFDGVDDNVTTPAFASPTAVSVACWAKSDTATWNAYGCLIAKRPSFVLHPDQGSKNIRFMIYNTPTTTVQVSWVPSASFDIMQWHHYAGVFNPDTDRLELYADGVRVASASTTAVMNGDAGQAFIGADDLAGRNFSGALDDARIYDRALSAQEIADVVAPDVSKVAHFSLDEAAGSTKAWDLSGKGVTGTLTNMATATAWGAGNVNGSLGFDGVDDSVVTSNLSTPASLTVACWAKSNTATWNAYGCLVAKRPSFVLHPELGSKNLRFIVYDSPTTAQNLTWAAPASFDITQWHHYAGVFNPVTDKMEIYVDGVLVTSATSTITMNPETGPIIIGADDYPGRYFNGRMDDVRVYSRALSWIEIMELSEQFNTPPYY